MSLKILQINAVHRVLSTGRNMAELNANFTRSGHQAIAAYSVGTVEDSQSEYLIGDRKGQKVHAFLSRLMGLQGYFSSHATRKLLRYLDTCKPDVVLLNNLHANYIHLPMLLKYLAKKQIPTVAVLHDCWFYTGKCCHYTVANCYRWQESCGNCPVKRSYNPSWFFDRTSKMLRDKKSGFTAIPKLGVIAVSDWLLNEAKKAPVFQNAVAMERIYNWIDTKKFIPRDSSARKQALNLSGKQVILCVAGHWDHTKGLHTVLELAEQLQGEEHIVMVGSLPAGTSLPQCITHIPKTDDVDMLIDLYNLSNVFFQPSLEETFGKVSAEALCCGTPVVCFRSTANPELIGPGCGAIVNPGDTIGALNEIRNILSIGKDNYKSNCRAFAEAHFEMEANTTQYLAFCQRLLSAK